MQLIHNWLNSKRNYIAGRSIYKVYGKDEALKKIFEQPETPIRKQELEKAIEALVKEKELKPAVMAFTVKSKEAEMPDEADMVLKAIRNEWLPLYQQMNYKRHQLDQWDNSNEPEAISARKKLAFEILDLEQQCMKQWARRDYYIKHGSLSEIKIGPPEFPDDPLELAGMISNLEKYIRRYKKKVKDDPSNATHAALLLKYQQQYDAIKLKMSKK